jgi:hypothetical protein
VLPNPGTTLRGEEEVFTPAIPGDPTPADSRAQGQAIFRVSADGATVDFRLIAANIDNVIMAHIHCGRFGEKRYCGRHDPGREKPRQHRSATGD